MVKKYTFFSSTVIILVILALILIRILLLGYTSPASDSVRERALWEWMGLLMVLFALAGGTLYFVRAERRSERKRAREIAKLEREFTAGRQQEAAFQAYIDRMAELLQEKNLQISENEEVRNAAKLQTLSILERLDGTHRGMVVRFLKESTLIELKPVIDLNRASLEKADLQGASLDEATLAGAYLAEAKLQGAHLERADLQETDLYLANLAGARLAEARLAGAVLYFANLSEADLCGADLERANLSEARLLAANLSGANLSGADLGETNLERANLSEAKLSFADLSGANLSEADLSGADLNGAKVTARHLATARSLKGTTMPDGTKHA